MKKFITIMIQLFILKCAYTQKNEFILEGQILDNNYKNGKVILQYKDSLNQLRKDSTTALNGVFFMKGNIPYVSRVTIGVYPNTNSAPKKWPITIFFSLESCKVKISLKSYKEFEIVGSKCYADQAKLTKVKKEYNTKELNRLNDSFIQARPDSYYGLLLLEEKTFYTKNHNDVSHLYQNLPNTFKQSIIGNSIAQKLSVLETVAIGKKAPSFELNDLNGKKVKLSDYRGKFIFLHFWGSFCNPCRMENKNLTKAYAQLKDKNIIFLGISVDESKPSLIAAIEKDNLLWTQLASFNGFSEKAVKDYSVHGVPRSYLINPKGLIVAKDLNGIELTEKIIGHLK